MNVLSPMLRIVEEFFSDFSKKHFEVVLFSEYVIKPESGTSRQSQVVGASDVAIG